MAFQVTKVIRLDDINGILVSSNTIINSSNLDCKMYWYTLKCYMILENKQLLLLLAANGGSHYLNQWWHRPSVCLFLIIIGPIMSEVLWENYSNNNKLYGNQERHDRKSVKIITITLHWNFSYRFQHPDPLLGRYWAGTGPVLGRYWADAASIGPVPAQCWHVYRVTMKCRSITH